MTVNFAMGRRAGLPGKGRRSGNVNYARPAEQVGLGDVIGRIEQAHAIGDDRVAVIIGSERLGGHAPDALIVFLHGDGLGSAFDEDGDFFVVGPTETKGYASIGANLRRNQGRRWCRLRLSGTGHAAHEQDGSEPNGKEQVGEPKVSPFHDSPMHQRLQGTLIKVSISERPRRGMIQQTEALKACKCDGWNVEGVLLETRLSSGYPHPGWFLAKSAESLENKEVVIFAGAKECARV